MPVTESITKAAVHTGRLVGRSAGRMARRVYVKTIAHAFERLRYRNSSRNEAMPLGADKNHEFFITRQ